MATLKLVRGLYIFSRKGQEDTHQSSRTKAALTRSYANIDSNDKIAVAAEVKFEVDTTGASESKLMKLNTNCLAFRQLSESVLHLPLYCLESAK